MNPFALGVALENQRVLSVLALGAAAGAAWLAWLAWHRAAYAQRLAVAALPTVTLSPESTSKSTEPPP